MPAPKPVFSGVCRVAPNEPIEQTELITDIPIDAQTFAIDLSKSWTTDSVVAVTSNKTSSGPVSKRPDLWYDPKKDVVRSVAGLEYKKNGGSFFLGPPQEWEFKPKDDGSVSWSLHTGDPGGPAANVQTC